MAGDYNRIADGVFHHFSSVLMQQGRVHLDSDWNEMARLAARRWTTQAADTFGPAAVPRQTTPQGFALTAAAGSPADLLIGAGRCYVDGLQAELFPHETVGGKAVSYLNQPFLPQPPAITAGGLAFLDVWVREVTAVEAPSLLDPALGGVDTTTRLQTVWQVKLLTADPTSTKPVSCATDLNAVFPASAGRITTAANAPVVATDPCILPDQGGYRGIENRLYRVQIHDGGDAKAARWKWSRENASVVSRVLSISTAGPTTLTLDRTGRDAVLRFSANDWVEITDDVLELTGLPGVMAKIVGQPNDTMGTVVLDRALPASFNPGDPTRHTRLIRWDQQQGVDADGLLPIQAGAVALEDGVMVTLALDPAQPGGLFHTGDWWAFAARTADTSVETLTAAAPFGIRHHYCPLATFTVSAGTVSVTGDCRVPWPPQSGTGADCCCTVCVTADGHNSGQATIAMALETVRGKGGGRVCLGPGLFALGAPLAVNGVADVIIAGQGAATALVCAVGGPAVRVDSCLGLRIEDLTVFALGATATFTPAAAPIGILLRNSVDVGVQRCGIAALAPAAAPAASNTTIANATTVGFAPSSGLTAGSATIAPASAILAGLATATPGPGDVAASGTATTSVRRAARTAAAGARAAAGSATGAAAAGVAVPAITGLVPAGAAIGLDGFIIDARIAQNELVAGIGIAKAGLLGTQAAGAADIGFRSLMLLAGLRASGNWILCSAAGVALGDVSTRTGYSAYALQTAIDGNFVLGGLLGGIFLQGYTFAGAAVQVAANHLEVAGPGITAALDGCTIADNHVTQLDGATALSMAAHAASGVATAGIQVNPIGGTLPIGEVRVLRNRVFGIFGPGIAINAPVLAVALIDNAIAATAGAGIVTGPAALITNAVVRGNEVFVVHAPASADAGVVAGIDIANAANAVIQDNVIAAIASTGGAAAATGIQLRKVARGTVSGNDISDVGQPGDLANPGYGIASAIPQGLAAADLTVRGNSVRQSATTQTKAGQFSAIRIRVANNDTAVEVSISGNVLEGSSVLPLVDVQGVDACVLTDNRCQVDGAASLGGVQTAAPAVLLRARSAIAGDNRIQGAAGPGGLSISVPVDANKTPRATVLGNIVTTGIQINGAALAAPWAPLNIIL